MQRFAELYTALDETTRTGGKVAALVAYLQGADPADAVWAIRLLMGRKPRQAVPTARLRRWAAEEAGIPDWLFDASYEVVGDLAETITLVLPATATSRDTPLHHWMERLPVVRDLPEAAQRAEVTAAWRAMAGTQRFVWNKLITGGFRVGVSQKLVTRALSRFSGIAEAVIAHRLMGHWEPDPAFYRHLLSELTADADVSRPYPFFLAYPLEGGPERLGTVTDWQAEWKWDGIRAQVVRREGRVFVWSRGEELVTDRFPEIQEAAGRLPEGCVLDGEILAWADGAPLGFNRLQQRIGRRTLNAAVLRTAPVALLAYDLLELDGQDLRPQALSERVQRLADLLARLAEPRLIPSPPVPAADWAELAARKDDARRRGVEGLMLKRRASPYRVGRRRGDWWKWKVSPLSADAVLTYAQRGHGRRSGLYTDYTFSIWDGDRLVPFAKAYSGLTDAEIREVDRYVRRHTVERFGPVRAVKPELVFEIAFEGIRPSSRHRSGVAVRFPRIARQRMDKAAADADTIETIRALLHADTTATAS
jgi:DNA ligase-1